MADPVEDVDDETLGSFDRVLKKYLEKNPEWLKSQLPSFPPTPEAKPADMTSYFRERAEKLEEMIEELRGVLTPEQLIQLRSLRSAAKEAVKKGEGGPPKDAPQPQPGEPKLPEKKKRGWL